MKNPCQSIALSAWMLALIFMPFAFTSGNTPAFIATIAVFLLSLGYIIHAPGGIQDIAKEHKARKGGKKDALLSSAPIIPFEHEVATSTERLVHMRCGACKGWWTVGDAPERDHWFCTWCGERLDANEYEEAP